MWVRSGWLTWTILKFQLGVDPHADFLCLPCCFVLGSFSLQPEEKKKDTI